MSDSTKRYPLTQASQELGIRQEFIFHCIEADWIHPASPENSEFDDEDLARLSLIRELTEDFGVNEEALPIILHLLDQVYFLRNRLLRRSA